MLQSNNDHLIQSERRDGICSTVSPLSYKVLNTNKIMLLMLLAISMVSTAFSDSVLTAPISALDGSISVNCVPEATRSSVGLGLECDRQSNASESGRHCRGVLIGEHVSPALCYCADVPANGTTLTPLQAAHLYLWMPEPFHKSKISRKRTFHGLGNLEQYFGDNQGNDRSLKLLYVLIMV